MDIKKVLEIVYLPDWNTHAYICEDGKIYLQLIVGRCFTKEEFLSQEWLSSHNEEFKNSRLKVFDELEEYYKTNYNESYHKNH